MHFSWWKTAARRKAKPKAEPGLRGNLVTAPAKSANHHRIVTEKESAAFCHAFILSALHIFFKQNIKIIVVLNFLYRNSVLLKYKQEESAIFPAPLVFSSHFLSQLTKMSSLLRRKPSMLLFNFLIRRRQRTGCHLVQT